MFINNIILSYNLKHQIKTRKRIVWKLFLTYEHDTVFKEYRNSNK